MSLFSSLSTAFTLGSTAFDVVGTISAGRTASKAGRADAAESLRVAGEEARVTEDEAQDTERRLSAIAASNRAARAASGVTREGSPLLTDKAFSREVATQIAKIRRGGKSRVSALETQAEQSLRIAKASKRAARFGAGTTLLTAGAEVFG